MALATGLISLRTGGLEAGIAVHLGNNLAAVLIPQIGMTEQHVMSVPWVHGAGNALTLGLLCSVVSYRADAKGWVTERPPAGPRPRPLAAT